MPKFPVLLPDTNVTGCFRLGIMAAAVGDSRVSTGKKLKNSLRKKKRMKMVVPSVASELEDKDKDASDNEGNLLGLSFGCSEKRPGRVCGKQEVRENFSLAAPVSSPQDGEGASLARCEKV